MDTDRLPLSFIIYCILVKIMECIQSARVQHLREYILQICREIVHSSFDVADWVTGYALRLIHLDFIWSTQRQEAEALTFVFNLFFVEIQQHSGLSSIYTHIHTFTQTPVNNNLDNLYSTCNVYFYCSQCLILSLLIDV